MLNFMSKVSRFLFQRFVCILAKPLSLFALTSTIFWHGAHLEWILRICLTINVSGLLLFGEKELRTHDVFYFSTRKLVSKLESNSSCFFPRGGGRCRQTHMPRLAGFKGIQENPFLEKRSTERQDKAWAKRLDVKSWVQCQVLTFASWIFFFKTKT